MGILIILSIFLLVIITILIEWNIGKAIGNAVSKETGFILGIVLIICGISLFIGIPVIIFSNKKESTVPTVNINVNKQNTKNQKIVNNIMQNNFSRFIGKNWKDVLLENNLGEYIEIFEKNKLTNLEIISELTEPDLEKLGITIMGDRKNILKLFLLKNKKFEETKSIIIDDPKSIDCFIGQDLTFISKQNLNSSIEIDALMDKNSEETKSIIIETHKSIDYLVKQDLTLFSEPNSNSIEITILKKGDKVSYLEKGKKYTLNGITASWFKIKNQFDTMGWCFSGFLKKI
jgi:hypothetical protein